MTTRFATTADIQPVLELLLAFGREAEIGFRRESTQDCERLVRMIQGWIHQHYVRVAQVGTDIIGVLIAERMADFWDPDRRFLMERAWYVLPEHRGSRASARLWAAWQEDCGRYIRDHIVDAAVMSTQGGASNIDLASRGWRHIESHWMRTQ